MTLPEVLLWRRLRARQPAFRRQHAIGPWILDFYCAAARLCVEVDGQAHDLDHDTRRDAWLVEQGITTLRLSAANVLRDPDAAADHVLVTAHERTR